MSITRAGDFIYALRFVTLLTKPWIEQEAYKYGIIDAEGNRLRRWRDLRTGEERDAFTYFHRIVFNMKRLLQKVSGGDRFLVNATASLLLLKEEFADLELSEASWKMIEESIYNYEFIIEDTPVNVTGAAVSTNSPKPLGMAHRKKKAVEEEPEVEKKKVDEAKGVVDKNHGKPPKPSKSGFVEGQRVAIDRGMGRTEFGNIKYLDLKSGGDTGASIVFGDGHKEYIPYKKIKPIDDYQTNPYLTK
jgi:transcription antitermination factor NusG